MSNKRKLSAHTQSHNSRSTLFDMFDFFNLNSVKCKALLLIWILLILPFASGLSITGISEVPTTTGATISYTTDSPATTSVIVSGLGSFPTTIESARTDHSIMINGLSPNTPYSFQVQAATVGTSTQTQTSQTQQFTTLATAGDIFFTSSIPQVTGNSRLTVAGTTIPDGFITILVNGQIKGSGVASPTGAVSIAVDLDTTLPQNALEVDVRDPSSGQTKKFPSTIQIDTVFPQLSSVSIPATSSSSTININGTTNKAMVVTAQVTYPDGHQKTFDGATLTKADNFKFSIDLDDGVNTVQLIGTDATGAQITASQQVTVDSQDLELDVDFSQYTPTATDTLYVTGTVNKPGIPVRIYVDPNNAKLGPCSTTTSLTLTPSSNAILNTSCYGFNQYSQVTINGSYFEAKSDTIPNNTTGLYPFTVTVTLEPRLTVFVQDTLGINNGITNAQASTNQLNSATQYNAGVDAGNAEQYSLFAVAVDNVGRVQSTPTATIFKQACGSSGDFVVKVGQIYPDLIEPDYIFQGIAQISFRADLQYTGIGNTNSVVVNSATLSPRQLSQADLTTLGIDPQQILDTTRCTTSPSSNIQGYVYMVCNLNRFPSNDIRTNITTAYNALNALGSVTFPVMFNVQYSVRDQNNKSTSQTATQCIDLSVKFDKRVDPTLYPNGLLKSTVKVLNETDTLIDQVLKPLNTIKLVTLGACVGSKVFSVFSYAAEESACSLAAVSSMGSSSSSSSGSSQSTTAKITLADKPKIEQALRGCSSLDDPDCVAAIEKSNPAAWNTPALAQDVLQSSCAGDIWSRLQTEQRTNYLCDRIFCPAIPSATEYIKTVNSNPVVQATSACSTQGSNPYSTEAAGSVQDLKPTEGCGKDYEDTWGSACILANPLQASQDQLKDSTARAQQATSFQQVLSNLNFCSAAQQANDKKPDTIDVKGVTYFDPDTTSPTSCYQLGTAVTTNNFKPGTLVTNPATATNSVSPTSYNFPANFVTKNPDGSLSGPGAALYGVSADGTSSSNPCVVTASDNLLIYQFKDNAGQPLSYDSGKADVINVIQNGKPNPVSAVLFDGQAKDKALGSDGVYYKLTGTDATGKQTWQSVAPSTDKTGFFEQVCQTSVAPGVQGTAGQYGVFTQSSSNSNPTAGANNCNAIQGPSQLKQNNAQKNIIDPTDGFINSVTCACLPAIEGYLIVWRNVVNAVQNCFQATLVNGEFKSGACRSLMTTYICDWIYRAINCVTNLAGNLQNLAGGSNSRPEGIGAIQSIQKGADDMSNAMQSRYGNTATYSSLIGTHKLINAVCLAAFGYDWLPDLDSAVSIKGGGAAINSTAFIVSADRRWISSDPTTGLASYVYEAGYFISAGSPIKYTVSLVCSNDYSCKSQDGYDSLVGSSNTGSPCDCAQGPNAGEKVYAIDGGVAEGGTTVGDSNGQGQKLVNLAQNIRYDKLRLTFTDTATPGATPQVIEQPISRIGGPEPPTCTFSLITFSYSCDYVTTNQYGDVYFYGQKLQTSENPYGINDKLNLAVYAKVDYTKVVGTQTSTLAPNLQLPKYAELQVWNAGQTQLLYDEITPRDTLAALPDNTPLVMGANYAIGDGQAAKGIAGTIRADGAPTVISGASTQILPFVQSSLDSSRASNKANYYVIYGPYKLTRASTTAPITSIDSDPAGIYRWIILRQGSQNGNTAIPLESLTNINSALNSASGSSAASTQGGYVTVIASFTPSNADDSKYGVTTDPYTTATKTLIVDASNGVQFGLGNFVEGKNAYSARITYNTQSTSTLLCQPNQKTTNLMLVVLLHDSISQNSNLAISPTNAQMSPAVFVYKGSPQNTSQLITVNCDGTSTTSNTLPAGYSLRACTPNALSWSTDTQWSVVSTSNILGGCYCGDPNTNVFTAGSTGGSSIIFCQSAVPPQTNSIAYPLSSAPFCTSTLSTNCYCSTKSQSDYAQIATPPATQGHYCVSPQNCDLTKGSCS